MKYLKENNVKYLILADKDNTRFKVDEAALTGPLYNSDSQFIGRVINACGVEALGTSWAALPANARQAILFAAQEFMNRGIKIEAIKILRYATDLGLKETTDFVDGYDWKNYNWYDYR